MFTHVIEHQPIEAGGVGGEAGEGDVVGAGDALAGELPGQLSLRLLALPFHLPELFVAVFDGLHEH